MDSINLWNTLAITLLTVIGGTWTFFKLFYKYKTKLLFITNCQILHKTIWEAMCQLPELKIKKHGEEDFAYRPLVLLPHSLKNYSDIRNGQKAILESVNPNSENNLKIIVEVYWIPKDMDPWGTIKHPVFSLILRRYFGVERPMYQDEDDTKKNSEWEHVKHSDKHLMPLNRADTAKKVILWAVSKSYTYRFFNPYDGTYHRKTAPDNFIEYCGLSIILRKRTLAHSDKD